MIRKFQVGQLQCVMLSDGQMQSPFAPSWETFFGPETGVSDEELRQAVQEEAKNRDGVALGYNILCLRTETDTILIDSGLGKEFTGYGPYITPLVGKLDDALSEAGISKDTITAVIFTHLHQDHLRGSIWSGTLTFPNATYFVMDSEIDFWREHGARPDLLDHYEVFKSALPILGNQLKIVTHETELFGSIRTVSASGHTAGHMAMLIASDDAQLLCIGDTIYDPLQIRYPHWSAHYDLNFAEAVATRKRLLAWAAEEKMLVHAYHMPFPGLGYIASHDGLLTWQAATDNDNW